MDMQLEHQVRLALEQTTALTTSCAVSRSRPSCGMPTFPNASM